MSYKGNDMQHKMDYLDQRMTSDLRLIRNPISATCLENTRILTQVGTTNDHVSTLQPINLLHVPIHQSTSAACQLLSSVRSATSAHHQHSRFRHMSRLI
ncbi:hypothetical protein GBA52_016296 [Prunus armeniaca]|nr:hypothetical protein GBA52_016296 [Prunus armeniaca]